MAVYQDDTFIHLASDIEKVRVKPRVHISHTNELGAKALVMEILLNALDECRNPKSPADKIIVDFDERTGFIRITDNGRGIPTDKLELILTTMNSGSNIDSGDRSSKGGVVGQNGIGTLTYCALAEHLEVTTYRGGTENIFLKLTFEEGKKIDSQTGKCSQDKHGMEILFKPSKILGKNTRIVWDHVYRELLNIQFTEKERIRIASNYTDRDGNTKTEKYHNYSFGEIVRFRNDKETLTTEPVHVSFRDDSVPEEVAGRMYKRFVEIELAMAYTNSATPYIDSFSNGTNTIDNGSHFDGVLEAICRFLQQATKASLSEKEREKLDVKWDDVKNGLSLAVLMRTSMEGLYTGQTKQKVQNEDLEKLVKERTLEALQKWAEDHPSQLKELVAVVRLNAKARYESEKVKNAVIRETMTNWSSFRMKNYDPCTNRGKEYKELFIIEGDSARGSLKPTRDPKFQALFAIRGVSANVFKMDLEAVLANREFNDLIKIMGCNVGAKFDMDKLQFNKIIIATDADVDGLFIRALLLSFFLKLFPQIIEDGRLFIAEPPLYRVADPKDPFVVNKEDYINRYINRVLKDYEIGFADTDPAVFMNKEELRRFLSVTSSYTDDIALLAQHYHVNERLIEMILHHLAFVGKLTGKSEVKDLIESVNIQMLMNDIGTEFRELYYDDKDHLIKGVADARYQSIEISERLVRKGMGIIRTIMDYDCRISRMNLREIRTGSIETHPLLTILKILRKYQPAIIHRFKGLGENKPEDIKQTILDPNTRTLVRVTLSSLENDMAIVGMLRGNSPEDTKARKKMMSEFVISQELIDT